MNRLVAMVAAAAMLSGCVSTKVSPLKETASLQGAKIRLIERKKPGFFAGTAGTGAIGGLVGAAVAITAGDKLVKENAVEDPAIYIGNELAKTFAGANGMSIMPANGSIATKTAYKELTKQYRDADLLLDVQTDEWSFMYFPSHWGRYRVIYSAHVRLIDVKKSKLLAEGSCRRAPEYSDTATPTYDELLADQAARLKQELVLGRDQCLGEFRDKVLLPAVKTASSAP